MKPDNDSLFHESSLDHKHDSKPSAYKNNTFDIAKLEGIMMENQNGALCDHDDCETNTAKLASDKDGFCNNPELECIMFVEHRTTGNGNAVRDDVAPCAIPSNKKDLFHRDMEFHSDKNDIQDELDFGESIAPHAIPCGKMGNFGTDPYTDKGVLECELPELLVCYKDNPFHAVKDICIDEGVPSKDKVSVGCQEENCLCTFRSSNGNKHSGLTGREDSELLSSCGSKSSSENDSDDVDTSECRTKEIELLSPSGSKSSLEDDCQKVDTHLCGTNDRVGNELLASAENGIANHIGNNNGPTVPVQSRNSNTTHENVDDVSREELMGNRVNGLKSLKELFQMPFTEQQSENPSVILPPGESSKCKPANSLSYDSKVESGTITFDFNSLKPATSGRDKIPDDTNLQPDLSDLTIDSENKQDDGISGNLSASSENQHNQGETSFSMATNPVSGLITYSGHIVHSGSVSHRSDSSTTSIRSFAFPVLQNEWNSSPIRMAKADRRHYRRHRGWQGVFCCRF